MMETKIYYIHKSELDAFVDDIGGTAVGHTPAIPLIHDPSRYWAAESEYITKHGVVLIRRYGDLQNYEPWLPKGGYIVSSYNQRAFDFATKRPMVKMVTPPPWDPNRAPVLSEPEPMEPAPAGVVVQQSLFE